MPGNTSGGGGGDVVANAQKLLDFQKTANAPIVSQLQSTQSPLEQRYQDILSSIRAQQQTTENYTTQATTSELGRRGLLPQSEEGQRTLGQALQPVTANFQNISANTGMAEQNDLNQLALNIANLQAGQPSTALNLASGLANAQTQAQGQIEAAKAYAAGNVAAAQALPYTNVGSYGVLNKNTGSVDYSSLSKLLAQVGGIG